MKQERVEREPHAGQGALRHIESEIRLGESELRQGHKQEGETILWKALAEASGQKDSEAATKILELLTDRKPIH
jgi:hypothetical protein